MEPTSAPAEEPLHLDLSRIAQDLQIRRVQVESVVQLLDEGNSVPFIGRYRRERTGGLPEDVIRRIRFRVNQLRHFGERKQTIQKSIESQGKLTDELKTAIQRAEHPRRLEDLYLPYKPKKKTTAGEARERGLEPAALAIWSRDPAVAALDEVIAGLVNPDKQLATTEDVVAGLRQIIAEIIAETADVRGALRAVLWDTGRLKASKAEKLADGAGLEYKDYFQFTEPVRHMPAHRVLAINRGEREHALAIKLEFDPELANRVAADQLPLADHPHREFLLPVVRDAVDRIVVPSLEREIRRELTERAQDHAIAVFARNLRSLLLQPPLRNRRVLGIDPAFRTGCRLAALDEHGNSLQHAAIHPHHPQKKVADARVHLENLIRRHQISVIAIGNGAASRETEELVAELIEEFEARRRGERPWPTTPPPSEPAAETPPPEPVVETPPPTETPAVESAPAEAPPVEAAVETPPAESPPVETAASETAPPAEQPAETPSAPAIEAKPKPPPAPPPPPPVVDASLPEPPVDLAYVIVNEAGASDYAMSPIGREELPNEEPAVRSAISIARRLQDPLAELVKVDPQHIGVGLYQHDVHARHLKDVLADVVESCVNFTGVDLNTAGASLLRHISGLNQYVARDIVDHRAKNGPFKSREQLKQVPSISDGRFAQAAGFVKVEGGDEPLDATWMHPESYPVARELLTELGFGPADLREFKPDHPIHEKARGINLQESGEKHHLASGAVADLLDALLQPGRDPRDDQPPPIFKKRVLKLEDLKPGMELKGAVLNVVDFGAFVDIGLKDSGLVHISQMANRYIKNPHELIAIGDVVTVWVMAVDADRKRVSLTMIAPGSERAPEPRGRPEQPPQGDRGPRGPRPQRGQRPQRGDRRGGPPDGRPHSEQRPVQDVPRQPRQLPPRRPQKPKPLPTLTQAKKEGKAYLNTLGELEAFFKARETPPTPVPSAEAPPAPPPAETPPPEASPAESPGLTGQEPIQ